MKAHEEDIEKKQFGNIFRGIVCSTLCKIALHLFDCSNRASTQLSILATMDPHRYAASSSFFAVFTRGMNSLARRAYTVFTRNTLASAVSARALGQKKSSKILQYTLYSYYTVFALLIVVIKRNKNPTSVRKGILCMRINDSKNPLLSCTFVRQRTRR